MGKIIINRKEFKSRKEACEYYNLNYKKVSNRLKQGWSIEEAFELVERNNKCKPVIINGELFISLAEACRCYNIDYGLVRTRINLGWSLQKIFNNLGKSSNAIPVTVKGKHFNSINEACEYYDAYYNIVSSRLKKGWFLEEAIFTPILIELKGNNIVIDGKEFISIAQACRYYDISCNKVYNRLADGWSIEEAFGLVERNNNCKPITLEGKTYKSINEACRYYNISYSTIYGRLKMGWSKEEAFGLVERDDNYRSIDLEGKHFNSIKDACKYYNLDYDRTYIRLCIQNWSVEEAFGLVKRHKYDKYGKITIGDKTFENLKEVCDHYNLNRKKVSSRLELGWSIEEAIGLIERDYNNRKSITIEGKTFKSITEACIYYNVDRIKVNNRMRKGWSIEETFELVKKEDGRGKKGTPITLEGKTYKSIKEACDYYNLSCSKVYDRVIKRKWSLEEAFELVPRKKKLKER